MTAVLLLLVSRAWQLDGGYSVVGLYDVGLGQAVVDTSAAAGVLFAGHPCHAGTGQHFVPTGTRSDPAQGMCEDSFF